MSLFRPVLPNSWGAPVVACALTAAAWWLPVAPASAQVNGTVRDMGDHRVVHLWGSPEEMGYAHGYLLGDSILALATGYALDLFGLTPSEYELFRGLILVMLDFPAERVAEAEALIEGMRDAGVELYREELGREIDADDVLLINAAADMFGVELGCSSISAWGAATEDDSELDGELAMARDLDWRWLGSEADLRDHSVVFAFEPSTPGTQRWISMAFPGFIGCLSCLNEVGVGAFQDQGNHPRSIGELDLTGDLVPIHLTLRAGVETRDYDGDGADTIHDPVAAVTAMGRLGTYDIHLISPAGRTDPPAAVLEADNGGWALRLPTDDPLPAPDCLAVTNHDRLLHPPEPCGRYDTIETMVDDLGGQLDLERLWAIEAAVATDWGSGGTIQTLRVIPAERRVDVAFADHGGVAADNPITSHEWSWLFEDEGPGDDDTTGDDDDDDGSDDDTGDDDAGDDDGSGGEATLAPGSCACGTGGDSTSLTCAGILLFALARRRWRSPTAHGTTRVGEEAG